MRLWTIHPRYLDTQGLVAVWREGLLAQAVLRGRTRGYKHHPQLARFRAHPRPTAAIALYLAGILEEAQHRGYQFDRARIGRWTECDRIKETRGQIACEWEHLKNKLSIRCPETFRRLSATHKPQAHPLFILVRGKIREWERASPPPSKRAKRRRNRPGITARPSPRPSPRSPS